MNWGSDSNGGGAALMNLQYVTSGCYLQIHMVFHNSLGVVSFGIRAKSWLSSMDSPFNFYLCCLSQCRSKCRLVGVFIGGCFHRCGSCGYPLNLSSSNRITSNIGSKYHKAIKKGIISFLYIDVSRFTQVDEVKCMPYSWGFYRMRTKLLCRKCGLFIGYGYEERTKSCGFDSSDSSSSSGTPGRKKYNMNIRALQPSDETDAPQLA